MTELPAPAREQRLQELQRSEPVVAEAVRALLVSDASASRFLDRERSDPAFPGATVAAAPGMRIGRFTLVRPLGTGGMGVVWQAEQSEPARMVAIKLVAWQTPSESERWRFRHEAQVLALLNHPAIATFYEAGTTPIGGNEVLWFAMELVADAVDIVTFADRRELSLDERLALFLRLCDAVDHGHQRGVLHRDLKPSNALVDGDGQLKLIDFGIARALSGSELTAQLTTTGEVIGTIHYMAPEQLAGQAAAIGVTSDVWSLGVILYRLICGRLPFDFAGLPLAAAARRVLDGEPFAPASVQPDLPVDLGWILLRVLEREPAHRYATVRALADDVKRWFDSQPVLARAGSTRYRLRKFVRRHRVVVAAATTIAIVAASAVTMTALALFDARRAEAAERQGRRTAEASLGFMVDVLSSPGPEKQGRDTKMVDALQRIATRYRDQFADDAGIRGVIGQALGRTMYGLGALDEAEQHLRASIADLRAFRGDRHPDTLSCEAELGRLLSTAGRFEEVADLLTSIEAKAASLPPDAELHDALTIDRGDLQRRLGDRAAAIATLRPLFERLRRQDPTGARTARVMDLLALVLHESGDIEAAEPLYREALTSRSAQLGEDHPDTIAVAVNLAALLASHGRFEAALPEFERVLAARTRVLGPSHFDTIGVLVNLGGLHVRLGQLDAAAARLNEALQALGPTPDDRSPVYQVALANLAVVERNRFHWPRAIELGEQLLALRERTRGPAHPETLTTLITLADTQRKAGDVGAAIARLTAGRETAAGASPPMVSIVYQCDIGLAWCHASRKDYEAAERHLLRCLETYDAAEAASPHKGQLARAEPDLVALYRVWGKPELAAKHESERSRAREPDVSLQGDR